MYATNAGGATSWSSGGNAMHVSQDGWDIMIGVQEHTCLTNIAHIMLLGKGGGSDVRQRDQIARSK